MAEVIGLRGKTVAYEDGANPAIVKELESLLEQARRGEIQAFAICFLDGGNLVNIGIQRGQKDNVEIAGAIAALAHDFHKGWNFE